MKRLISVALLAFALQVLTIAQTVKTQPLVQPVAESVAGAIAIPPERVKELQVLVSAAQEAQQAYQFAGSVFIDTASPCVKQVLSGLKAEAEAKLEKLNNAILTERIQRDVPKEFVLNDKWTFIPPPPSPPAPKKTQ
jgi:hypothetical protein